MEHQKILNLLNEASEEVRSNEEVMLVILFLL